MLLRSEWAKHQAVREDRAQLVVPLRMILGMIYHVMPNQKSGTYNCADPTAFRKAKGYVVLPDCGPAGARVWYVDYDDVTWGIGVTIEEIVFGHGRRRCTRPRLDVYQDMDGEATWRFGADNKLLLMDLLNGDWYPTLEKAMHALFDDEWSAPENEWILRHTVGDLAPIYQSRLAFRRERKLP